MRKPAGSSKPLAEELHIVGSLISNRIMLRGLRMITHTRFRVWVSTSRNGFGRSQIKRTDSITHPDLSVEWCFKRTLKDEGIVTAPVATGSVTRIVYVSNKTVSARITQYSEFERKINEFTSGKSVWNSSDFSRRRRQLQNRLQ